MHPEYTDTLMPSHTNSAFLKGQKKYNSYNLKLDKKG